eukprot:TRINITY_DN29769_c0_g1_i2.p1 TRINITY_DN29769_c0_g1~~TRINITY_DN29769_c0_g1_i2.p1  ORF type:complete len:462 (-),score=44.87 TRINITY_DN29769_c0_g1_i2:301-1686(-)
MLHGLIPSGMKLAMRPRTARPGSSSPRRREARTAALCVAAAACLLSLSMGPGTRGLQHSLTFQQLPTLPAAVLTLLFLLVCGKIGSKASAQLGLPPLLGMLLAGYVLRNAMPWSLSALPTEWNAGLRKVALGIIMVRGGMSLNLTALREQFGSMVLLSWVPCLAEASTIACICRCIFPIMDWNWAFMLGFVIADVSPAVTTPILLDLMARGYGAAKGIPSVLLAAGNINSVFAIVLYSMIWEVAWSEHVEASALLEIVLVKFVLQLFGVGVLAGIGLGFVTSKAWNFAGDTVRRFAIVVSVAMASIFGFAQVGMGGGGTLAVLTFGASLQYNVDRCGLASTDEVTKWIGFFWSEFGQICLFTLLGASVDQSKLDSTMLGWSAMLIVLGLIGRSSATILSTAPNSSWNYREKLYVVVSWCRKATVQAALATRALDYVTDCVAKSDPAFQNEAYVQTVTGRHS